MKLPKIYSSFFFMMFFTFTHTGNVHARLLINPAQWKLQQSQWQLESSFIHLEKQISTPQLNFSDEKLFSTLDVVIQNIRQLRFQLSYALNTKNIPRLEVNIKNQSQKSISTSQNNFKKNYLDSVWIGNSFYLKKERNYPEIRTSLDFALLQKALTLKNSKLSSKHLYLSAIKASLVANKTLDPLILSCLISYTFNFKQKPNSGLSKISNKLTVQPSIYFLVNPNTSLAWGTSLHFLEATYLNQAIHQASRYHQTVFFGLGFTLSATQSLNVSLQWDILGQAQRVFALKHIWTF